MLQFQPNAGVLRGGGTSERQHSTLSPQSALDALVVAIVDERIATARVHANSRDFTIRGEVAYHVFPLDRRVHLHPTFSQPRDMTARLREVSLTQIARRVSSTQSNPQNTPVKSSIRFRKKHAVCTRI